MSHPTRRFALVLLVAGCGAPSESPGSDGAIGIPDGGPRPDGARSDGATPGVDGGTLAIGLAAKHPCDVGIDQDPAVVFAENFEEASVGAVTARYDDSKNAPGMALVADVPAKSCGKASMKLTAGGATPATDLYKKLDMNYDELYIRYYVKYQTGIDWHHTGVWTGGYNPATPFPNPMAGLKPNGDDRFSVAFEPTGPGPNPQMDFYNYWMTMHSWMDVPMGNTAYYGNTLIHQTSLHSNDGQWMCFEIHVKVNPDPASPAGGELGLFLDDVPVVQFNDQTPTGYWIKDKFCPQGIDGKECTNYPPPPNTPMIPLDLQVRNTAALGINVFWPQNYITAGPDGSVQFDDMVVAKTRIGCLR